MRNAPWLILLIGLAGCSDGNPKRYPVHGKVRFPDGKLLTTGTVEFQAIDHSTPMTATGTITPEGTFELGTLSLDDGAIAGRHRVIVLGDGEIGTGIERPGLLPPALVHPRYRDFKTSGLEVTVEPQNNDLTIDVQYAPRGKR
jgi:hypothetical protein